MTEPSDSVSEAEQMILLLERFSQNEAQDVRSTHFRSTRQAFCRDLAYCSLILVARLAARNHRTCTRTILSCSLAGHSNILVQVGPELRSTAFGRYQILKGTDDSNDFTDFSPLGQDSAANTQMANRGCSTQP
jgi:hypothetical protein